MLLEIACFNLESCLIAQKAGAHRIELCENYKAGGITPSEQLILEARRKIQTDLFVMIRPRGGNFIYSEIELEEMRSQIEFCKELKCNGFVFGILTSENKVDSIRCKELVELAKPLPCTFHRAFDEIENQEEALEEIIKCGFKRILTSGKKKTAIEGSSKIVDLIQRSKNRIQIMPGGGIRSTNISELKKTGATEFHSAAITNPNETVNETEIKNILALL
jgi:copper homeostasis protein